MQSQKALRRYKVGDSYSALWKHFGSAIWDTKAGKVLVGCWAASGAISVILGIYKHLKKKREDAAKEKAIVQGSENRVPRPSLVRSLLPIIKLAFPSVFCQTTFHMVVYTFFLIIRILLTVKIARLTGKLSKMIGARTFTEMFQLQAVFGLWCYPAAVVNSMLTHEQHKFALAVREELTKHVHSKYLKNLLFYRATNLGTNRIEDIDQRVTQDLKMFCQKITELYGNLLKPSLEVIILSQALARMMGVKQLIGFFLYFLFAGQWLRLLMPPFAKMTAEQQQLEGVFRSHHSRIINHSEEIAFYKGSERESEIITESFENIKKNSNKQYFLQTAMGMLDSYTVKYGATMVAYSMLIPAVYLGTHGLKGKSTSDVMEYYFTCTQLFVALGQACKHLVLSYKRIQAVSGLTTRISGLLDMLQRRSGEYDQTGEDEAEKALKKMAMEHPERSGGPPEVSEGEEISFENVDLFSPTGALLVKGLTFKVAKNTNVLISGPNGSGKSSLFRTLGGLWPLCSGKMVKPPSEKLYYIPQQPYFAPGTLRDQVTYPLHFTDTTQDATLEELMDSVGLSYLIEREGGWDSTREWADVLSGGEKQRVAMARLFFHRPAFGILDECTSAVSVDVEGKIYETCKKYGITIFTVSHRPQLSHHHDYMLAFDGKGGWKWSVLHEE